MNSKKRDLSTKMKGDQSLSSSNSMDNGRIVSIPDKNQCLDYIQLNLLEQSFREWAEGSPRADVRLSRRRILIIFLLIRYTGAKLNELLALNPFNDIDLERKSVCFRGSVGTPKPVPREVQISEALSIEIQSTLADPAFRDSLRNLFDVDPGFVRRKFYERANACGFFKHMGGPEMIRKARAVELIRSNMPLPAVQILMGHSTPNLTSTYISFSDDEIRQATRFFLEKESSRKTSARNSFFGKIQAIQRGDIQTLIQLITIGGHTVTTVITNDSLERLCLKLGGLITAEVKAPWVILQKGDGDPECTAENRFNGSIVRINRGGINTEYVVRISDGTELCSVVNTESSKRLEIKKGDKVWVLFSCFSVVLHAD